MESSINLPENLSNELEPSVRFNLGTCMIREDSTVNLLNSPEDLYNNQALFQFIVCKVSNAHKVHSPIYLSVQHPDAVGP